MGDFFITAIDSIIPLIYNPPSFHYQLTEKEIIIHDQERRLQAIAQHDWS
jgi:hypothetical protein